MFLQARKLEDMALTAASENLERFWPPSATAASPQRTRISEKCVPQRFKLVWRSNFPAVLAERFSDRGPFGGGSKSILEHPAAYRIPGASQWNGGPLWWNSRKRFKILS